jgi:hypothetical protein
MNPDLATLGIMALAALIVFLIARELVCWYWKINETVRLLTEIRDLLKGKNDN